MFFHRKELMVPVEVRKPDPIYAQFLLQQFGGATGELTAGLQYWIQSFHCPKAGIREMPQDIAVEEFGHLELVGKLIEEHTREIEKTAPEVQHNPIFAIRGRGPHLVDDAGVSWTAAYINEGGDVVRDLRTDIAAEAGARETYEVCWRGLPIRAPRRCCSIADSRSGAHEDVHEGAGVAGQADRAAIRQHLARRDGEGVLPPVVEWAGAARPVESGAGVHVCGRSGEDDLATTRAGGSGRQPVSAAPESRVNGAPSPVSRRITEDGAPVRPGR